MIAAAKRLDRAVLTENDQPEITFQRTQNVAIRCGDTLRRNARHLRDDFFDHLDRHAIASLCNGLQPQIGAGLVHDINRLVRQMPIVDMPRCQFGRRLQRAAVIAHAMVLFKAGFEAVQDSDGFLDAGFRHIDLLEAPRQCMVLLEDAAILGVRG